MLRFDPFRDFDRLAFGAFPGAIPARASIPMDVVTSDSEVTITFDLPGINPDDVSLTVDRNRLTVEAARERAIGEGQRLVTGERPTGSFSRTIALSERLDSANVSARFDFGVLTITIPVAATAQPRRIEISTPVAAAASEN